MNIRDHAAVSASRSSLPSDGGGDGDMSTDLSSLFICPVCFDYILPPILQCFNGHLVCESCHSKINRCPICRGRSANIRNLAMEKVAENVKFPCKHSSDGCTASLAYAKKTGHEEKCDFRPYLCPCPGVSCKWQGSLHLVLNHLTTTHRRLVVKDENIIFQAGAVLVPDSADWSIIQSCFGHHFMVVLKKQKHRGQYKYFAFLQLIGSRKEAKNFVYRLQINGNHRHLFALEATPHSIRDSFASVVHNTECLVLDSSIVKCFVRGSGCLDINVHIRPHKTETSPEEVK